MRQPRNQVLIGLLRSMEQYLNRPVHSSKNSQLLNEAKCKNLACENEFYLRENEK